MPTAPRRPCGVAGCPRIATHKYYCEQHANQRAQAAINELRKHPSRPRASAAKRGYTPRWQKARKLYLIANPTCVHCGKPASCVDHIVPHRGDPALMWNEANWQPLCASCHSVKTMTQDVRGRRRP